MLSNDKKLYLVHKRLIIKAIEELHYEEILVLFNRNDIFELRLANGLVYHFEASLGPWDNLQIFEKSFKKFENNTELTDYTMNSFFKEIQSLCEMSDDTLSRFLEEGNHTIFSDLKVFENLESRNMKDLLEMNYFEVDQMLSGHPKLIMNKGRLGWGQSEIQRYSPEYAASFKLRWIAVSTDIIEYGINENYDFLSLVHESIAESITREIDINKFLIIPVHPWQWDRYISVQFLEQITIGQIKDLGEIGEEYTPQISIRTLTQVSQKATFDIKQSLSILNTSCVRGIPSKYIKNGHLISNFVEGIIFQDKFLKGKVVILNEVAAVRVKNCHFDNIEKSSYRYKELLGVVWREAVSSKLEINEKAVPTAALFCKNSRSSYIKELINNSGLSPLNWITKYFETVIIPLYHLQLRHGLGLVSHGQNIILVLKNNIPHKVIIKDFHGDLRISNTSSHLHNYISNSLDKLEAGHLIHDLITGHFISVLRYVSRIMEEEVLLEESIFYKELGNVIHDYNNSINIDISNEVNLLKDNFEKILVNKIRFIEGYGEIQNRLKPKLGNVISNPLIEKLKN